MPQMNATQILERTPEMLEVQAETRRYCEHFDITNPEEIERTEQAIAYRRWTRAIEPLQRLHLSAVQAVIGLQPVQYILHKDGKLERQELKFPADTRAMLAQIDEMILEEARRYGLKGEYDQTHAAAPALAIRAAS